MTKLQPGIYQHYKGNNYEVIDVAYHSETMDALVVYKQLYASAHPEGTVWVRPLEMFQEEVEVDGKTVPRFRLIAGHS